MACNTQEAEGVNVVTVERDPTAEDDKTKIRVVPIGVTDDDSTVSLLGMFFDNWEGWTEEDEPQESLTIESDRLDRSTGFIIGRFAYDIAARAKIMYRVCVDGKIVDGYGTGLPYGVGEGQHDTTLFKYPNSAKANKPGLHKVHVDYALITGIAESQLGLLEWGKLTAKGSADFEITLLPHKIQD